jgi:hypothetical protein
VATIPRVEHLLSAPLFLSPQLTGDRVYFVSNLSGRLSIYAMDAAGSVPEPLLPPDVALFTPAQLGGEAFVALPDLGVIVVMIDNAGDENLQPCVVPIDAGSCRSTKDTRRGPWRCGRPRTRRDATGPRRRRGCGTVAACLAPSTATPHSPTGPGRTCGWA